MSEWWTYRPSDFLLFSPRVYERLIESHNAALGPWRLVALAAGLAVLAMMIRRRANAARIALVIVGVGLAFSGWSFLWGRYAGINWAAAYAAPAFWIAGAGFLAAAFVREPQKPLVGLSATPALALIALAIVGYPLAAPVLGKPWIASEIAGIMPNPTALAALGVAALMRSRPLAAVLLVAPLIWSLYAAMTLWTLRAPEAWMMIAGLVLFSTMIAVRARTPHEEPKVGRGS